MTRGRAGTVQQAQPCTVHGADTPLSPFHKWMTVTIDSVQSTAKDGSALWQEGDGGEGDLSPLL